MKTTKQIPIKPRKGDVQIAKFMAIFVRNNMEDFHVDNLTDEQMKELNPLIRQGILEAIHTMRHSPENKFMRDTVGMCYSPPEYWENPELTDEYKRFIKMCNNET